MKNSIVRLTSISIENFKNVKKGQISLLNRRKEYASSILGLYGQNGSGKTALIDVIQLLKYALSGMTLPSFMADYVNIDASYAVIKYGFAVKISSGEYEAFYELKLRREEISSEKNTVINNIDAKKIRPVIFDETLEYTFDGRRYKARKTMLLDTRTEMVFIPAVKYACLLGKNEKLERELLIAKKIAERDSRSFIFSRELLNAIRSRKEKFAAKEEFVRHVMLLERLVFYGNVELFVINTLNGGMISMDTLPLAFKFEEGEHGTVGNLVLPLEAPAMIPHEGVEVVKKIIRDMNVVLEKIVPGLTIGVKELGTQVLEDGKVGCRIQLVSHKNSKEIPLKCESEGIKKIISILHLLIVLYNHSSITVAIDELDAGIFEYLLGELLRIISEKGKGQLIFTSHNLRPLETLDRGFIAFTTANPVNRYIRLINIKDSNNLRDFYFRDITLGEQPEVTYDMTNNAEIALAFREAGEMYDT